MARSKPTARRGRPPIWHAQRSEDAPSEKSPPAIPPIIPPGLQHWPVFLLEESQVDQHVLANLYEALDPLQDERPAKRRKLESSSSSGSKAVTLARYSIILATTRAALESCDQPFFSPEHARSLPFATFHREVASTRSFMPASYTGRVWMTTSIPQGKSKLNMLVTCVSGHPNSKLFRAFSLSTNTSLPLGNAVTAICTLTPDEDHKGIFRLDAEIHCQAGMAWRSILSHRAEGEHHDWVREFALQKTDSTDINSDDATDGHEAIDSDVKWWNGGESASSWWTPQSFYECAHLPNNTDQVSSSIQPLSLTSELFPFQKKAVSWLLGREGFQISSDGRLEPLKVDAPCPSFETCEDADGNRIYASALLNGIMDEEQKLTWNENQLRGGILAEEMGLGKTVELIALILLHQRTEDIGQQIKDTFSGTTITGTKGTLIITPPSILQQWISELASHAPSLTVYHYKGVNDQKKDVGLKQYDVVLTTYNVLSREIHYAGPKADKGLRHEKKYQARRSPLVGLSWWRICLDEAQMIEGGVSNAAIVARQIPRCNAWAISGTPFKRDIKDLQGLLSFLRYDPFCITRVWELILKGHRDVFTQIFSNLALRHTKESIRSELTLPAQKRIVITVPFSAIEEQNYSHLFQQMCDDSGLDRQGGPLKPDWNPEDPAIIEKMRQWLVRLRQACLHPEVGSRNRRALGRGDGPLRTIEEVLDVMIDQNEAQIKVEERAVVSAMTKQGHIYSFGKQPLKSLKVYLECMPQITKIVDECRQELEAEKAKVKAEGEERERKLLDEDVSEADYDLDDKSSKVLSLALRLRQALELQHVCAFFLGTTWFQVRSDPELETSASQDFGNLEEKEIAAYEQAKAIRTELLTDASSKARKLMDQLKLIKDNGFASVPTLDRFQTARGIESRRVTEKIDRLRDLLNGQAVLLDKWRQELTDRLLMSLLDQDDSELTGEEYEQTTIRQDEQYAYIAVLRALVADRQTMLTGQPNVLVNYEMKEAMRLAKEEEGPAPELMRDCLAIRSHILPEEHLSLRGIIADLRGLITSVRWQAGSDERGRSMAEAHILEQALASLHTMQTQQSKIATRLEKEIDLSRATMNARLDFYRQVQEISDAVAPLQEEASDEVDQTALQIELRNETKARDQLALHNTKRRFLQHLKADSEGQAERMCIICQDGFEVGVLTVCGHQFCKECINLWYNQHKSCPVCKRRLATRDFHEVMYKPRELEANVESTSPKRNNGVQTSPGSTLTSDEGATPSIYTDVSERTLNDIKSINLPGSFGTKIDTISRHLLYIRQSDPGAKAIIFSQYRDFLNVLGAAFTKFKIGFADIAAKDGITRFREDPAAECFLLHAKADSSGLNLVNATHVFLCEPLINAALELQAIARVHRIGQRRPTTVWMYLVRDSVEEAIYDISVRRRMEHVRTARRRSSVTASGPGRRAKTKGKGKAAAAENLREEDLENADSGLLQSAPNVAKLMAKGASGGELVGKDDLWQCLFGTVRHEDGISSHVLENGGQKGSEVGKHLRAEAAAKRANA